MQLKILTILIIFSCITAQAIAAPWYLTVIQQTPLSYQNKCRLINTAQTFKKITSITRALLSSKENHNIAKDITEKRLAIKNTYCAQKQKILLNLGKTLGFSQQQWSECRETMNLIKNLTPQQTHVFHDPAIPPKLYNLLIRLLHINEIDPQTINLKYQSHTENGSLFAQSVWNLEFSHCPQSTNFIQQPQLVQTIILYDNIVKQPKSNQLAILAHEIEHIHKKDGIECIVIEKYLQHYHQKDSIFLEQNREFKKLKIIHEAQAEIFAALKNPTIAQALVNLRARLFYPDHLYENHYHTLVEINNLWKLQQFL